MERNHYKLNIVYYVRRTRKRRLTFTGNQHGVVNFTDFPSGFLILLPKMETMLIIVRSCQRCCRVYDAYPL